MSAGFSWEAGATLSTPGPSISFMTGGATDDFYVDSEQSDWQVDVRLESQEAPRAHGMVVFPPLKGAGHLKIAGRLKPVTDTAAARNAMALLLEAAAEALMGETLGTFACERGSIGVTLEMYPVVTGGFRKSFVIGLLAPDPTWS